MSKMRTFLAVMCLAVMAGCGGSKPAGPTDAEVQAFLQTAHGLDFYAAAADDTLTDLAGHVCGAFDSDNSTLTWAQLIDTSTKAGAPAGAAGGFVAISVSTYCPQYLDTLP